MEIEYKTSARPSRINRFIVFLIVILVLAFFYIPLNLNIVKHRSAAVLGWNYNTSRDTKLYITSDQNSTLIEPYSVCDSKVLLMIFVCSAAKNFDARDSIRATWKRLNYQPYFKAFHPQAEFGGKYLQPDATFITDEYLISSNTVRLRFLRRFFS